MQETENTAPPERLSGSMPFQGLRRPPAVPEGLAGCGSLPAVPVKAPVQSFRLRHCARRPPEAGQQAFEESLRRNGALPGYRLRGRLCR